MNLQNYLFDIPAFLLAGFWGYKFDFHTLWGFGYLLSPASYAFNPLSLPNFLITGVLAQLGFSTLLQPTARVERGQAMVNRAWFVVCLVVIIWQFCFGMLYMSQDSSVALFWDRLAYVGVVSIPATFMRFTIAYLGLRRMMRWWWPLAGIGVGFILLLPSSLLVRGIRYYEWGPYTLVGAWHHPFLIYFTFTMGLSFFLFFRRLFSEQHPIRRRQIRQVLVAFLAADLGAVDYLPAYGINLLPLGNLAIIAFMSLATWFIVRHRALQLSPAVAANQILTAMTNLLIVFQQDRRIALANQAVLGIGGISHRNLIGQPLDALLKPSVLTEEETWATLNKGGNILREDIFLITATGESIAVGFTFSAVKEEKGAVLGYIGLGWDRRPELERLELKEALLESQKKAYTDLQVLNQAKQKMLDHLSHEMRTPIAIISACLQLLNKSSILQNEKHLRSIQERLERNLKRLLGLWDETVDIALHRHFKEKPFLEKMVKECQDLFETLIEEHEVAFSFKTHLQSRIDEIYLQGDYAPQDISLYLWVPEVLETIQPMHQHRQIVVDLDLQRTRPIHISEIPLRKAFTGLVRNAIESTPDGSKILIRLYQQNETVYLQIKDFGVGISTEFQEQIFHGFIHPTDTQEYSSLNPYDFGAGGKGGDLLRIKLFSERSGFRILFESEQCPYIQKHGKCPGSIKTCSFCLNEEDCYRSGGSLFCVEFPPLLHAREVAS